MSPTKLAPVLVLLAGVASGQRPAEGPLEPHLGEPAFELHRVFETERFPCIVVAVDGSVIATWGSSSVRARRSHDGGASWGKVIPIADPGFQGGGTIVDERSGDVLAFVESGHPPAEISVFRSRDHGETWETQEVELRPNSLGHLPSMHMNDSGITLRHGEHAGRLVRPTRYYAGTNDRERWPEHYTNAIYSDDGGRTWQASEPFPEKGTGEATVAELSDGRLYYNSRVHWPEAPENTRRRRAWSTDGGRTWEDWAVVDALPDGRQDRSYGCMGGLARLPIEGRDVLIFSNLDTPAPRRERITVWASLDGGGSWPVKRLVYDGPSAYSSLAAGRPDTPSEGWIYLQFEGGPGGGCHVARFDLAWVLAGEPTGDGEIPEWISREPDGFQLGTGAVRELARWTCFALALLGFAEQEAVLRTEGALVLELGAEETVRVALELEGKAGFIRVSSVDCDVRAGLEDGALLDRDRGPGFDELLEVSGTESRLTVAGAGGSVELRWVPSDADGADPFAEIVGYSRFLCGRGPPHEKRAAIGEVYLLGCEAREGGSGYHLDELIAALEEAELADPDLLLRDRVESLLRVYLAEVDDVPVGDADWLRAHVSAAKRFQWIGEYRWAGRILATTAPRREAARGSLAVELHLLLADTDTHLGHHERSGRHCDRVSDLLAGLDLGRNQVIAIGQLARVRFRLGQFGAVRLLLAEGSARAEEEGRSPASAVALWETAALLAGREHRREEAVELWDVLIAAVTAPDLEAGFRVNRGRERRELGALSGARADFERAFRLAREGGFRNAEAGAREGLARIHLARGDTARAREEIEAALRIEREDGLADYLAHSLQTLALIGLREGDLDSARRAMEEADSLLSPEGLTPRGRAELRSRFSFWSAIAQDVAAAERRRAAPEEREAAVRQGLWLAGQWSGRAMLHAMRARVGGGLDLGPDQLLAAAAPALGAERALVRFAPGSEVLRAYVVASGEVTVMELGDRASIEASAARYLEEVCCGQPGTWAAAEVARLGRDVFERVLEPLVADLPESVEALVVVPSESLVALPFEALVVSGPPRGDSTFENVRYLVERFAVTYAPSVPIFAHLTGLPRREGGERTLYLGDTVVPRDWGGLPVTHRLAEKVNGYQRLTGTREEVLSLAWASIPRERRAPHQSRYVDILDPEAPRDEVWTTEWFDLYLGARATPAVLAGELRGYAGIHIACHGFRDPQDPASVGLVLSGSAGGDDGLLDLGDIRACEVSADLVVLAGCDTGSGQLLRGEGVQSIAAAFLEAGARSVVASQWVVDDDRTRLLMIRFALHCARGLAAPLALEAARRDLWSRPLDRGTSVEPGREASRPHPRHPYHWASFVYVGGL